MLPNTTHIVGVLVIDFLEELTRFSRPGADINVGFCIALSERKQVMEPLLEFCIRNVTENPVTGLEWAAAWGKAFFYILSMNSMQSQPAVKINREWEAGR